MVLALRKGSREYLWCVRALFAVEKAAKGVKIGEEEGIPTYLPTYLHFVN